MRIVSEQFYRKTRAQEWLTRQEIGVKPTLASGKRHTHGKKKAVLFAAKTGAKRGKKMGAKILDHTSF
jgi:hypothetical protein